jgi:alpha-tubulin suppressor-like RCC1 family protein
MLQRRLLACAAIGSAAFAVFVAACVGDAAPTTVVVDDSGTNDSSTAADTGGMNTTDSGGGTDAGTTPDGATSDGGSDAGCVIPSSPYLQDAIQVGVGNAHACAIRVDGSLVCWGDNSFGQLGVDQGTYPSTTKPVPVSFGGGGVKVLKVLATEAATMILDASHHVWMWGENENAEGLLGQGSLDKLPHPTPAQIMYQGTPLLAADIALGWNHACALSTNAAIICWGDNEVGQVTIGSNATKEIATPTLTIAMFGNANTRLFAGPGANFTCALDSSGSSPHCWGETPVDGVSSPTTFIGDTPNTTNFVNQIEDGGLVLPIKAFALGNNTACLLDGVNHVGCGGSVSYNMLDPTVGPNKAEYTIAPSLGAQAQIAHSQTSICTLDQTGAPKCWGNNGSQQLGRGGTDKTTSGVPTAVVGVGGTGSLAKVTALAPGFLNVCAILEGACPGQGGPVVCWGDNYGGQLGRDDAGATSGTPEYVLAP